jgi:quercetin dioxygenase-like cupin family protein
MFLKSSASGYIQALPGIQRKTLAYGDKSLLTEFRLAGGSLLPSHAHPQEQTGYLVSGHMRLTIAGETFDIEPGDSWCVPGNVTHQAEIIVDSVAVEVFSPIREDYLPRI